MERHGQPVSLLTEVWSSWASRFGGQALGVRPSVAGVVGPLSTGPEWSTGSPELESDRTPCRVFMLFFRIITWGASALFSRAAEVARFPSTFWVASPVRVSPHLLAPCYPGVGSNWNFTKCLPLTR